MGHAAHKLRRRWIAVGIISGVAGLFMLGGGSASAQPKPAPAKPPAAAQVGDVVILQRAARPNLSSPPEEPSTQENPSEPKAGATREDADAAAISAMFESLRGADLVTRIRRYEDYVRTHPEGRFARV